MADDKQAMKLENRAALAWLREWRKELEEIRGYVELEDQMADIVGVTGEDFQ